MLIPFLGIPLLWKQYIIFAIGIFLLLIGYVVRRADYFYGHKDEHGVLTDETFVEATTPLFSDTKTD